MELCAQYVGCPILAIRRGGFLSRRWESTNLIGELGLQLYLFLVAEKGQGPAPKGRAILLSFRGLKPPAPSGISDLQL